MTFSFLPKNIFREERRKEERLERERKGRRNTVEHTCRIPYLSSISRKVEVDSSLRRFERLARTGSLANANVSAHSSTGEITCNTTPVKAVISPIRINYN